MQHLKQKKKNIKEHAMVTCKYYILYSIFLCHGLYIVVTNFLYFFCRVLFQRCREEGRTLLTTSYKLLLRKDCPPGTYLIQPQKKKKMKSPSSSTMEESLVQLLLLHGVILYPSKFLSKCVVCNGIIQTQEDEHKKQEIFQTHGCSDILSTTTAIQLEVYQCNSCQQGYWWSDNPNSSASRVKVTAIRLFQQCLRGGIPYQFDTMEEEKQFCNFWGIDLTKQQQQQQQISMNNNEFEEEDDKYRIPGGIDEVMSWLKNSKLHHDLDLQSTYNNNNNNNDLPFTNVTRDFIGTLDYIFFERNQFDLIGRLHVPTTLKELSNNNNNNNKRRPGGHLLPSDIWPSDHLAIGAYIQFKKKQTTTTTNNKNNNMTTTNNDSTTHVIQKNDTINSMKKDDGMKYSQKETVDESENNTNFPIIPKSTIIDSVYVPPEIRNQMFVRIPRTKKKILHTNIKKHSKKLDFGAAHVSSEMRQEIFMTMSHGESKPIPKQETSPSSSSSSTISSAYVPPELCNQEIMTRCPLKDQKEDETVQHDCSLRCECGRVPKVKSLFEMAELRKQARLKKLNATK